MESFELVTNVVWENTWSGVFFAIESKIYFKSQWIYRCIYTNLAAWAAELITNNKLLKYFLSRLFSYWIEPLTLLGNKRKPIKSNSPRFMGTNIYFWYVCVFARTRTPHTMLWLNSHMQPSALLRRAHSSSWSFW